MKIAKLNILLSLLFAIVASFATIHQVEHIKHHDSSQCLVCVIKHNLSSADAIKSVEIVKKCNFRDDFTQNKKFIALLKPQTTSNKDPPASS